MGNTNLIAIRAVKEKTGYRSAASIYAKMKQGSFPRPIKIQDGSDSNRWLESEIDAWIAEQIAASRSQAVAS